MSTATAFVRPAGWSCDNRMVTFGRDVADDGYIALGDLADPNHYRSITERLMSAHPSAEPWEADVVPLRWAAWTASAVLLAPALVDGRVLLVEPDQLGVVVNDDADVERFWARPSECELRATSTRTIRVVDSCLAPVVDAAVVASGLDRQSAVQMMGDAILATCDGLRGRSSDAARRRVGAFIDAMRAANGRDASLISRRAGTATAVPSIDWTGGGLGNTSNYDAKRDGGYTTMKNKLISTCALAALAVAVGGCGGTDTKLAATTVTTPAMTESTMTMTSTTAAHTGTAHLRVVVKGGAATGDTEPTVALGSMVMMHITADAADTVHVHGYDKEFEITAGKEAMIEFTADIPGRFEVEMHHSGAKVMELTVK